MKKTVLNRLESLPFFSLASLKAFGEVGSKALYQNIQRWVRSGDMIRLKNGLYVTKTHVDRSLHNEEYLELVANKLTIPSCLSLEYVLQKNNLLTEATYPITSVTLKTTRRYENKLGIFQYHHLQTRLYSDFEQRRFGPNIIYEATPAKALFDYLYLHLDQLDPGEPSPLEEMRINWSELTPLSFRSLIEIISKTSVKKMEAMVPLLEEIYHGNTR